MRCIRDVERIGDYATNFDEMAKKAHDQEVVFSDNAKAVADKAGYKYPDKAQNYAMTLLGEYFTKP